MKLDELTEDQIKAILQAMKRTACNVDAVYNELRFRKSLIRQAWEKHKHRLKLGN